MDKGKKKYINDIVYNLKLIYNLKFISKKTNLFPNVIEDIITDYLKSILI